MSQPKTLREASCADDYDPNSMPVATARALIRTFLSPVAATERVHVRQALSRVLAAPVVSPFDVPGHDNSAMDGYAVRFADLDPQRRDDARARRRVVRRQAVDRRAWAPASACASSPAGSCPRARTAW